MNVNVLGVVNTIKAFVPIMQEQDTPGVMCATSSIGGLVRGDGGGASYQASKHAVVCIQEALSFELARRHPHIRVHVLCPCIANSALNTTSQTNKEVASGNIEEQAVAKAQVVRNPYGMAPDRHAEQVWDRIRRGEFNIITDNGDTRLACTSESRERYFDCIGS